MEPPPKPWQAPPTKLSEKHVAAVAFLLRHGLADPRGGEYRQATVKVGNVWRGDGGTVTANGWAFPDGTWVGWNGLRYRPISLGAPASIDDDLPKDLSPTTPITPMFQANQEGPSLKGPSHSVGAAMLLILGEANAAERAFGQSTSGGADPLRSLAASYLSLRFDRAVAAHMRGDDALAASDAAALAEHRTDFDTELRRTDPSPHGAGASFLEPVERLKADSLRRLAEGKRPASGNDVISLIARLDEVSARQRGQPGGVDLTSDPVVSALVKIGNPAVEPLLDAIENDERLTRSVSFGRDFFPTRNLISVRDAAFAAFRAIVGTDEFRSADEARSIATLRAWWKENAGKTQAERWFATLANDSADWRQWTEAARKLVDPVDIQRRGHFITGPDRRPGDAVPPMKAEELRGRRNPSLSDLLAKRALQLAGSGEISSSTEVFQAAEGLQIGVLLAKWDPARALPTLQALERRAYEIRRDERLQGNASDSLFLHSARAHAQRIKLGDSSAAEEFLKMIETYDARRTFGHGWSYFRPLTQQPENLVLRTGAEKLFLGNDSRWNLESLSRDKSQWNHALALVPTPLLRVAAFRKALDLRLSDDRVIGKAVAAEGGGSRYSFVGGASGGGQKKAAAGKDPYAKPGDQQPIRVKDSVAWELSSLDTMPRFELHWPAAVKDRTIASMRQLLRQKGATIAAKYPFWVRADEE